MLENGRAFSNDLYKSSFPPSSKSLASFAFSLVLDSSSCSAASLLKSSASSASVFAAAVSGMDYFWPVCYHSYKILSLTKSR